MNPIEPQNEAISSTFPRRIRALGILLSLGLLAWLSFEANQLAWVLTFSAALSVWTAAILWRGLTKRYGPKSSWLPLAGFIGGLLETPAAIILMALKTGLHGHQGPDFSGEQIIAVLTLTPVWLVCGLLIGFGLGLFNWAASQKE